MEKMTRLKHPVDVVCAIARAFDTSSTAIGVGIREDKASSETDKQRTMPEINGLVSTVYARHTLFFRFIHCTFNTT